MSFNNVPTHDKLLFQGGFSEYVIFTDNFPESSGAWTAISGSLFGDYETGKTNNFGHSHLLLKDTVESFKASIDYVQHNNFGTHNIGITKKINGENFLSVVVADLLGGAVYVEYINEFINTEATGDPSRISTTPTTAIVGSDGHGTLEIELQGSGLSTSLIIDNTIIQTTVLLVEPIFATAGQVGIGHMGIANNSPQFGIGWNSFTVWSSGSSIEGKPTSTTITSLTPINRKTIRAGLAGDHILKRQADHSHKIDRYSDIPLIIDVKTGKDTIRTLSDDAKSSIQSKETSPTREKPGRITFTTGASIPPTTEYDNKK